MTQTRDESNTNRARGKRNGNEEFKTIARNFQNTVWPQTNELSFQADMDDQ